MDKFARKFAALAIVATAAGLCYEVQVPDGKWQRAPLSGALILGAAAVVSWACKELDGGPDAR